MANRAHEGEYGQLFDLIRGYVNSTALRHVGSNYELAEQIADGVRTMCSAGLVPVLDFIVVEEAVAYIRDEQEADGQRSVVDVELPADPGVSGE